MTEQEVHSLHHADRLFYEIGIAWLVLGELNTYGLSQLDAVHAAIAALEFNLAVRLLHRFLHESKDKAQFRADLCAHVQRERLDVAGSSLLHDLANLRLTAAHTDSVQKLLGLLAPPLSALKAWDKRGASPVHYACHMHNFAFVDFVCAHYRAQALELLTFQDAAGQAAYALLFWQMGRVEYGEHVKDKIRAYTLSHVKQGADLESVGRAYFPLTSGFLHTPTTKIGKLSLTETRTQLSS